MAAVAALHLGIEIPNSRYLDFTAVGAPQLIADNACADQFVLGPEVTHPGATMILRPIRCKDGSPVVSCTEGAAAMPWATREPH